MSSSECPRLTRPRIMFSPSAGDSSPSRYGAADALHHPSLPRHHPPRPAAGPGIPHRRHSPNVDQFPLVGADLCVCPVSAPVLLLSPRPCPAHPRHHRSPPRSCSCPPGPAPPIPGITGLCPGIPPPLPPLPQGEGPGVRATPSPAGKTPAHSPPQSSICPRPSAPASPIPG